MNSIKGPLIFFALILLVLVGASLYLGNPGGTIKTAALANVEAVIKEIGLNFEQVEQCVENDEFTERVSRDLQQGTSLGVTGTPAIILLDIQTGNTVFVKGAYPFEPLKEVIDKLMEDGVKDGDVLFENKDLGVRLSVEKIENIGIVEDDHLRGNPEARIAMIEFSDLDCPYCAQFHGTAINLVNAFAENGDLVWVYRHFPIASLHPVASQKAAGAECAGKLGGEEAFWAVIDTFYSNVH